MEWILRGDLRGDPLSGDPFRGDPSCLPFVGEAVESDFVVSERTELTVEVLLVSDLGVDDATAVMDGVFLIEAAAAWGEVDRDLERTSFCPR